MKNHTCLLLLLATSLISYGGTTTKVSALEDSLGEKGIDVLRLQQPPYNLQGKKVSIGQIEVGRPKKFAIDKLPPLHKKLPIKRLFFRNLPPVPNQHIDNHAHMVSSVMIANQKRFKGIAPLANLYIGAIGSLKEAQQPEECLTTQNIALQDGGMVRAINLSFGESLARDSRENPILDGNALLTQCLDWSARVHNVVYVVAGNQGKGGIPIPTDNYNGITTAYSQIKDQFFRKVDFANLSIPAMGQGKNYIAHELNFGTRRSVSLLAPGNKIKVYNIDGRVEATSGSSFAAPHVTGTIALLQEAGDRLWAEQRPLWTKDYQQHEVMKAILLTSADKLQDQGDGSLLGMTRTVLTQRNQNWLFSEAHVNPEIPLHMQMGAGHLNGMRAYQQLVSGQWNYHEQVALRGWNYEQIEHDSFHEYVLREPLRANSYISITLVWDRLVDLQDSNGNQQYDLGESFIDRGLNNLDLELVTDNSLEKVVCASVSKVDSVEHIFCRIDDAGKYKIRVKFKQKVNHQTQDYALAWHAVSDR